MEALASPAFSDTVVFDASQEDAVTALQVDGPSKRDRAPVPGRAWVMLALATVGFAVNFWAWALISPLGPMFRDPGTLGALTESDVALLVAVPVLVGSLGRIVVGALTDRYGGRVMFPLVSAATIVPVLFIAFVALDSYAAAPRRRLLPRHRRHRVRGRRARSSTPGSRPSAAVWRSASSAPAWAAPRSAR